MDNNVEECEAYQMGFLSDEPNEHASIRCYIAFWRWENACEGSHDMPPDALIAAFTEGRNNRV